MTNIGTSSTDGGAVSADTFAPQNETAQLANLSSVLNGLEGNASIIRQHVRDAMNAVQSGTYRIDPVQLSRCIVSDALGNL